MGDHAANPAQTEIFNEKNSHYLTNKLLEYSNEMQTQPRLFKKGKKEVELKGLSNKELQRKFDDMFGETEEEMADRIREKSIYK